MKIRLNLTISAFIAIVLIISSVNAKPVTHDPDNQSRSTEPSAKQSPDIHLHISHISSNITYSTTDAIANTTLVMSPSNTTTETSMFNNNATTFIEEIDNDTTGYTSSEETNMEQATTIASVETVTENQRSKNVYSSTTFAFDLDDLIHEVFSTTRPSIIIDLKDFTCPDGHTKDTNGGCEPVFDAKLVSQNPDNQSRPAKPLSMKQSSNINLPISYIGAVENSKTGATANTTLIMSLSNTYTSSANIATETSTSDNISSITFVEKTDNDTIAYTSSEKTNMEQATTTTSVKTVTIGQITKKVYSSTTPTSNLEGLIFEVFPSKSPNTLIDPKDFTCPDGHTRDANGGCEPIFVD